MLDENLQKLEKLLIELKEEADELMTHGNSKEQEKGRGILYAVTSTTVAFKNYTASIPPSKDMDLLN